MGRMADRNITARGMISRRALRPQATEETEVGQQSTGAASVFAFIADCMEP
jgi:hypothetical protein